VLVLTFVSWTCVGILPLSIIQLLNVGQILMYHYLGNEENHDTQWFRIILLIGKLARVIHKVFVSSFTIIRCVGAVW
jgi:hypothetical protein